MSMHWNSYGKYLLTGVVLGSFLFYAPHVTEAKRHKAQPQPKVEQQASPAVESRVDIRHDLRREDQLHATSEKEMSGGSDFQ